MDVAGGVVVRSTSVTGSMSVGSAVLVLGWLLQDSSSAKAKKEKYFMCVGLVCNT